MANVGTVRTGLANRLKTISGLTVHRTWPNVINPPCAVIRRTNAEPEQTFGRGDLTRYTFDLYLFGTMAGGYESAQDNMDRYLSVTSTGGVFGAIAADRTLGGVVDTTFVRNFREDDELSIAENVSFQAFVGEVECWAT